MTRRQLLITFLLLAVADVSFAEGIALGDRIAENMAGATEFLIGLYYIVGVALIFSAINKLKKYGNRTAFMNVEAGIVGPTGQILVGAALIYAPTFLETINQTVWGSPEISSDIDWVPEGSSSFVDRIKPIIAIVQFIGMIALLRGFLILTKATGPGSQPGQLSKGFVHILGGVLSINIVATTQMIVNTFGI